MFGYPLKKCEIEISIKKGSASPSITRIQFPLKLLLTSTVHKVQDLSLVKGVLDFICISKNHLDLGKYIPRTAGQNLLIIFTTRGKLKTNCYKSK